MYKILRKEMLTPTICLMEVEAPRIAAAALPGQFLIVRAREQGERIPLTICDYDRDGGTVTIVTQIVGASSRMICALETGQALVDVVGPLGRPSDFVEMPDEALKGRRYLFVAGGLGTAPVYPQAKYLHERGAQVDIVVGAKTADLLILRREMASVCDHLYVCTDDGSEGHHGLVTEKVKLLLAEGKAYDQAVAIGPMIMMKFVTLTLKDSGIPLVVSLNTLMVDGTGMCGCCRITVGGKVRFACVEGPEFDAYAVDFDEALRRQTIYRPQEIEADHKCKIGRN
ncbi:MAG: sulfide/dihydroorotate dehydrogenase-like FAD/NAD-binding protein [Bacteroidales bacterium]|nr:sulfide/dihydroorotate dehydrogenase-like FAD/NAD-binding protein [Bacteroidales bacterium]MBQ5435059.1 sulfide/dihydroorotate dehydrogenase-like FAD/NAD-binding protein [Bacteroidales bacterium]MBQ5518082.1 sulfide/dihydroorotate dehydrogenase-like FAD/NAD-binding protein [Bacteroidales bacterium]MBQ5529106.1 sulfide/dihydroorotate dehydrogenase-like FAD/NAD-binding protein [Bacteroidales bacterium]